MSTSGTKAAESRPLQSALIGRESAKPTSIENLSGQAVAERWGMARLKCISLHHAGGACLASDPGSSP